MVKNKKKQETEEEDYTEESEEEEDNEDSEDIETTEEDNYEEHEPSEEYFENPLHLAGKLYAQSDLYTRFPHLSPDVKVAFFDKFDKINFRYKSSAYQTYTYIKKIIGLASIELKNRLLIKKAMYECKNLKELEQYFKNHKQISLFMNIRNQTQYSDKELDVAISSQIDRINSSGIVDEIFGTKEDFNKAYNEFMEEAGSNEFVKYIDDIGLMNDMATYTESSKAYKGNERNAINTTISISKDVDSDKQSEEEPEDNETGNKSFKKFFGRKG